MLAAVGALAYFTGFYAKMVPAVCALEAPFSCVEHKVTADGTVALAIQNAAGFDTGYTNITVWCNQDSSTAPSYSTALVRGQQRLNDSVVVLQCPIDGKLFRAKLFVTYVVSGETTEHIIKGDLRAPVE